MEKEFAKTVKIHQSSVYENDDCDIYPGVDRLFGVFSKRNSLNSVYSFTQINHRTKNLFVKIYVHLWIMRALHEIGMLTAGNLNII